LFWGSKFLLLSTIVFAKGLKLVRGLNRSTALIWTTSHGRNIVESRLMAAV
jgi:hypothetical protein